MTQAAEFTKNEEYKYGFVTDIEVDALPKGLNEDVIRHISARKKEPEFMLQFRLNAYRKWLTMEQPKWQAFEHPPVDYQDIVYFSAPKKKKEHKSLDEVDPALLETYAKLGIPLEEQKQLANVAVDAVFDSVSVATTHRKRLMDMGVYFCSISDALQDFPELVEEYIGSVVPPGDNFYSALNSAVFTDGSFVFIPPGLRCPLELSTYFRINNKESGQFERTLIIACEDSYVSYLEGCTAPQFDSKQLHAAVVELIALDNAEIKYSTVQNWFAGDRETGVGGVFNFVTKRGLCKGRRSKISWTQVETGAAITWKYPSVILRGDESVGEFYSVAVTNGRMIADTGTKMVHIGKNTKSTIISKGISTDKSIGVYRGLVKVAPGAAHARNYSQCDSMLIGGDCAAYTIPYIESANASANVEHEASTSKVNEEQLFYLMSRGIDREEAIAVIVSGFCRDVFVHLPLEFASESEALLRIKLENSVG